MTNKSGEVENQSYTPPSEHSKLYKVREQLKARPDVFYAGDLVCRNKGLVEIVDIFVAPTQPIYDPEGLNQFMDGLIKDIPTQPLSFGTGHLGGIDLGHLYYDDVLGEVITETTTRMTASEPETLRQYGLLHKEYKSSETRELKRRTIVRPYPDIVTAQAVFTYEKGVSEGTVKPDELSDRRLMCWLEPQKAAELEKRQKSWGKRIRGLLPF